jgi:hypothetical protein
VAGARDRLREVQQAQASALSAYVSAAAKVDRAREELERHEDAVRSALGLLASTTSLAVAAELTGVSVGVARDALAAHRRDTAAAVDADEPVTGRTAAPSGVGR